MPPKRKNCGGAVAFHTTSGLRAANSGSRSPSFKAAKTDSIRFLLDCSCVIRRFKPCMAGEYCRPGNREIQVGISSSLRACSPRRRDENNVLATTAKPPSQRMAVALLSHDGDISAGMSGMEQPDRGNHISCLK